MLERLAKELLNRFLLQCRGAVWGAWFIADEDLEKERICIGLQQQCAVLKSVQFRQYLAGGIRILFIF